MPAIVYSAHVRLRAHRLRSFPNHPTPTQRPPPFPTPAHRPWSCACMHDAHQPSSSRRADADRPSSATTASGAETATTSEELYRDVYCIGCIAV